MMLVILPINILQFKCQSKKLNKIKSHHNKFFISKFRLLVWAEGVALTGRNYSASPSNQRQNLSLWNLTLNFYWGLGIQESHHQRCQGQSPHLHLAHHLGRWKVRDLLSVVD